MYISVCLNVCIYVYVYVDDNNRSKYILYLIAAAAEVGAPIGLPCECDDAIFSKMTRNLPLFEEIQQITSWLIDKTDQSIQLDKV